MFEKLKNFFASRVLFVIVLLAVVYLAASTVKVISKNWQLQQEIATLRSEVELLQAENERLSYDIQYYKTDEYLEQAARQKLNLKGSGETVTIVGDVNQARSRSSADPVVIETQPSRGNWQSWVDFLFRGE